MEQANTQVVILDSSSYEDIFVCGCCKLVFNLLKVFLDHKKFHCARQQSLNNRIPESSNSALETNITFIHKNRAEPAEPGLQQLQQRRIVKETSSATGDGVLGANKCTICKKTFKRPKCLYAHWKLHVKPSQCKICGKCFQDVFHLRRHIVTHKVWPDGLNKTTPKTTKVDWQSYCCSYCEAVLPNYSQFKAHLNIHLDLKKFKCIQGDCTHFFGTVEEILDHINEVHSTVKYTCHICKKLFLSLTDIADHYETHNLCKDERKAEKLQYKCPQCDATFKRTETLSLHLLTETHNKSCIHCKKSFASDKRLRMHLQIHKKIKGFQCEICSKSFQMKKYLNSHMLKHGDRCFVCKVCKDSYKRQDLLLRHMKTHSKTKQYKCPFKDVCSCTKEFYRSDKLKQHIKAHAHLHHYKAPSKTVKPIENTPTTVIKESVESGTIEICIVPFDNQVEKTDGDDI